MTKTTLRCCTAKGWRDVRSRAPESCGVSRSMLTDDEPLRLGAGTKGIIDEVVVWPRALAAEEVARLAEP